MAVYRFRCCALTATWTRTAVESKIDGTVAAINISPPFVISAFARKPLSMRRHRRFAEGLAHTPNLPS
ncbi:hypothetical protein [Agrobacterium sp. DSM 25558]|uniref:hypothetical protein n=1 Tax=Agrobacterium sp. DSM 25558 TaxID=1907665 RepID=UPI0013565873|nr:hypothetical protein [Agrobacterium sp. DSM 25558]